MRHPPTTFVRPVRSATARRRGFGPVPPVALVLISVCSVQFGQAAGKTLFSSLSPAGVVTLRLVIAAAIVGIFVRPGLPENRREVLLAVRFGSAIAGMNLIYPALQYLPLGVAITVQLSGPLAVAVMASRRRRDVAWGLLAAGGLALFGLPSLTGDAALPARGIALAAVSAVSMGCYVLLSKKAGGSATDGRHLVWALVWASLLWAPFGITADTLTLVHPDILAVGLLVAILSAALPYSLELSALRNLSPRIVGTLQSLEPALGASAGLLILSEMLNPTQLVAIACVTTASIAAVATSGEIAR